MSVEVVTCSSLEELDEALSAINHYFGLDPSLERTKRFAQWIDLDRVHASRVDGQIVGGAGALDFDVSVPGGGVVPCAGVTVVGVLPTYRRRGVLTALMREQLADVHRRGEPVAALWASESTIYPRYGYGLASREGELELPKEKTAFAEPVASRGVVRLVDAAAAAVEFPPLYETARTQRPGMMARSESWWTTRRLNDDPARRHDGASPLNYALLELDGTSAAYALYRVQQAWGGGSSTGKVQIIEVVAATAAATREIWRWLFDFDWTSRFAADLLPVDHPLFLLLAEARRMRFTVGDGLWIRLVDIRAALRGRSLRDAEPIVLEIADELCPWNAGTWRVHADGVEQVDSAPELALGIAALGCVYLGGFSFAELARAGRLEERVDGAVARADDLFRTDAAPWCPEIF